jgi:PhnB protein
VIAPWLTVADGTAALAFYRAAFGAVEVESSHFEHDGRVQVAQLLLDGAAFWISEDRAHAPLPGGGAVRMIVTVDDPDAAFARALAAGATEIAPVYDGHGWRIGRLADPEGHHWELGRPLG